MPLPREYAGQPCSLARTLEIVGERWSLLIVRDAFFGVARFSDFAVHLDIPRAILTERLNFLVGEGILDRGPGARPSYALTDKGMALWPVVRAMVDWGDDYYSPEGPRRVFIHTGCDGRVAADGHCAECRTTVAVQDITMTPGPGCAPPRPGDRISAALAYPRPLVRPIR